MMTSYNYTTTNEADIPFDGPAQPDISHVIIGIALSFVILLTVVGNIIVIAAFLTDSSLRYKSVFSLYIVNLAFADLLLGVVVLPFSTGLEIFRGYWLYGESVCLLWISIDVMCCTSSIYGLCLISIDRFIGARKPLHYPIIVTRRRATISIFISWAISFGVSIGQLFGWRREFIDHHCEPNKETSYVVFSVSASFYVPLIIICILYSCIYKIAITSFKLPVTNNNGSQSNCRSDSYTRCSTTYPSPVHRAARRNESTASVRSVSLYQKVVFPSLRDLKHRSLKKEFRAAKTLGIIVGVFIICWFPFFIVLPLQSFTGIVSSTAFSVAFWAGYLNSCINPWIYAFSSRRYRHAFIRVIRILAMCRVANRQGAYPDVRRNSSRSIYTGAR